jgi:hypothetical protein
MRTILHAVDDETDEGAEEEFGDAPIDQYRSFYVFTVQLQVVRYNRRGDIEWLDGSEEGMIVSASKRTRCVLLFHSYALRTSFTRPGFHIT